MKNEKWIDIEWVKDKYQISNFGRVKSLTRIVNKRGGTRLIEEKIIKHHISRFNGYAQVNISLGQTTKVVLVHRLVAIAFIPNPENKPQVNHKNGDKIDNRTDNLEWCTISENALHSHKMGFQKNKRNELDRRSKKIYQIDDNDNIIKVWPSTSELKRNGFNYRNIHRSIKNPKLKAHGYKWSVL